MTGGGMTATQIYEMKEGESVGGIMVFTDQMLKFYLCVVAMNDFKNNVSTTLGLVFSPTFPVQKQIE